MQAFFQGYSTVKELPNLTNKRETSEIFMNESSRYATVFTQTELLMADIFIMSVGALPLRSEWAGPGCDLT